MIATQCVLHYTVMAASFCYLKPFLSAFDSGFGATIRLDHHTGSQSYGKSQNTYAMKSMSRAGTVDTKKIVRGTDAETERHRSSSQDSKAPIIMKTQTFQVHTEERQR